MTPALTPSEALAVMDENIHIAELMARHSETETKSAGYRFSAKQMAEARATLSAVVAENERLRAEVVVQMQQNREGAPRELAYLDRATRAESENESLRAEMGRVRLDAERYYWLRSTQRFKHYVDCLLVREEPIEPAMYDASIDAAIAHAHAEASAALAPPPQESKP
jgi:hypothetical protein